MANTTRLVSLDVFRGITISAMILVNNPGSWSTVYSAFQHAEWHGVTPTDWIFPFFIFIVGVAIAYAIGRLKEEGIARATVVPKIVRRSLLIFGVGLFLSAFPGFDWSAMRFPGVLQRIALVYGMTALLFLWLNPRQLFWVGMACLLGYWGLMTLVPVPGGYSPNLDPATNLGAWVDRTMLGGHLWATSKTWDPEGLLGTIPALATSISGILTGVWLRSDKSPYEKVAGILAVGTILLGIGAAWGVIFPLNKQLWTSSYVLYTSGIAMLFLGVVYWWVDIKGRHWGTKPFVVYGVNALAVFTLSGIIGRTLNAVHVSSASGSSISVKSWMWQSMYQPLFESPYNASLAHAITHVLILLAISWFLYSRKIFIRV
jgi:predicted acyltransferase